MATAIRSALFSAYYIVKYIPKYIYHVVLIYNTVLQLISCYTSIVSSFLGQLTNVVLTIFLMIGYTLAAIYLPHQKRTFHVTLQLPPPTQ